MGLYVGLLLSAQDIKFTASASPNVLRVGDQFTLTYSSNQELGEIKIPEMSDFELIGGPSQGHSQSVYSENGTVTSVSTWQYSYFLRATKEGKFTIPSAWAKYKGKAYQSNELSVEVVKAKETSSTQNRPTTSSGNSKKSDVPTEEDLYVRLFLDKNEVYIGEQIVATVKIFTKVNLTNFDAQFKGPEFTGFFTEPVEIAPLRRLQQEAVNGDIYGTGIIRKVIIIPQRSGELVIQPFNLDVVLRREVRRKVADPFFDDFLIPDVQEIPVKLTSKSVRILVKPLPPNAPSSFKGAVGSFSLASSLNKSTAETNEPITLKVILSGRGNIKLINEVEVSVPYDFERYDPVISTQLETPTLGKKTFEYLIEPRIVGDYTIAPVEFAYFDPEKKLYRVLRTSGIKVKVKKGQGDTLLTGMPGVDKKDVRLLNQDIMFIKTKMEKLQKADNFFGTNFMYYGLYAFTLFVFILLFWLRKHFQLQKADMAGWKLRKAAKFARKKFIKSENLLKQGNISGFYEELAGAIWGYLGDKLQIPVASLSRDYAGSLLESRAIDKDLIHQLFSTLDACEMARFAKITGDQKPAEVYTQALDVISQLQQKLK